jgi:hypothetical protein
MWALRASSVRVPIGVRRVGDFDTDLPNKHCNIQGKNPVLREQNPALCVGAEKISGAPRRGPGIFLVVCPYYHNSLRRGVSQPSLLSYTHFGKVFELIDRRFAI